MRRALVIAALLLAGCITVQAPQPARCPPCQEEAPSTEPREPAPRLPKPPSVQTTGEVRR